LAFGVPFIATAAACATLDEIDKGALEKVNAHGEKLKAGIGKILQERGIPGFVQGPAAMLILQLAPLKKPLKK